MAETSMGVGAGLGAGAAGFGRGLANALLQNRERSDKKSAEERARRDRLFMAVLPSIMSNVENVADLEPLLAQQFPETFGGTGKKGKSAMDTVGKFLGPFIGLKGMGGLGGRPGDEIGNDLPSQGGITGRMNRTGIFPSQQPEGITGGTIGSAGQPAGVSGGVIGNIPQTAGAATQPESTGPLPIDQAPDISQTIFAGVKTPTIEKTHRTLFGVPVLSAEEKDLRQQSLDQTAAQALVSVRRKIAEAQGLDPAAAQRYALTGDMLSPGAAQDGYSVIPAGASVLNRATGAVSAGPAAAATGAGSDVSLQRMVGVLEGESADKARAFFVNPKTGEITEQDGTKATGTVVEPPKAPTGAAGAAGATDVSALAAMVAKNPAVLQGLTPTVTSGVMSTLAKDPQLRAQYEQTRMVPIRAHAETALTALKDLVQIDPKTNKITGLTPGAIDIYGANPIGRAQRLVPGSPANDAKAALDQVTGQLTLDLLAQMKAQSRTGATGFGQLSVKELNVLESAATVLKGEISEDRALQELTKLRDRFQQIMQQGESEAVAAGAGAGGQAGPVGGGAAGATTVTYNGKVYTFPDAARADLFKRQFNIK